MKACRCVGGPGTSISPRSSTSDPVIARNRRRNGDGRPTVAFGSPRSGSEDPTSANHDSMNGGNRRIQLLARARPPAGPPGGAWPASAGTRRSSSLTGTEGRTTRRTPADSASSASADMPRSKAAGSSPARGTTAFALRTRTSTSRSARRRCPASVTSRSTTSAPRPPRRPARARSRTLTRTSRPCARSPSAHADPSCPLPPTTMSTIATSSASGQRQGVTASPACSHRESPPGRR